MKKIRLVKWVVILLCTVLTELASSNFLYTDPRFELPIHLDKTLFPRRTFYTATPNRYENFWVNPMVAFDLGLLSDVRSDTSNLHPIFANNFVVSETIGGSGGFTRVTQRSDRRAAPLGWSNYQTFNSNGQPTLTRIMQKGDVPTGEVGHHDDGKMDQIEIFQEMIISSFLQRAGVNTTVILVGASIKGDRRNIKGVEKAGKTGVVMRLNNMPRLNSSVDPVENLFTDELMPWSHPLIKGDMNSIGISKRRDFLTALNSGILKSLWFYHGSAYTHNLSPSSVDYGTGTFMQEPNGYASTDSKTRYMDEIFYSRVLHEEAFDSSFALEQLRRIGLPDEVILSAFAEKELPESEGNLRLLTASKEILGLATSIMYLDKAFVHSVPEAMFSPDPSDPVFHKTSHRVIFNTRKVLRNYIEMELFKYDSLPSKIQGEWARKSVFSTFKNREEAVIKAIDYPQYFEMALQNIHETLNKTYGGYIKDNLVKVLETAKLYPTEQKLPTRVDINTIGNRWMKNPGAFNREFQDLI